MKNQKTPEVTIVVPVYRSQASIVELYDRLKFVLESQISPNFELILVDDASPDLGWGIIQNLADQDDRVTGIQLTRNFGQYYALTAGLDRVSSDWTVIMDCDLQDQPEEIPKLYHKALEGYEIVLGRRVERQDSPLKRFCSWAFYKVFSYLTGTRQDPETAQFGIYHRNAVSALCQMRERLRFIPAFISWMGYRVISIPVEHAERTHSPSSYSLRKLFNLAFDTIIAFSDKPLRLTIKLGFTIAFLSIVYALYLVIESLQGHFEQVVGWPSLMVSVWFFSGLMIFVMGIIGIYVAKIFDEVKQRPLYLVRQIYSQQTTSPTSPIGVPTA